MNSLKVSHSFVYTLDYDAALAFYRDVLGMEVATDADLGHMRWLSLRSPAQPDVEIVLAGLEDHVFNAEDRDAIAGLVAKGGLGTVIFATDDVGDLFERVQASGAEVLQEPTDQPYGVRDCAFRDPSGNHLRFSQHLG